MPRIDPRLQDIPQSRSDGLGKIVPIRQSFGVLSSYHYLGPTKSADFAWRDENGVMVFAAPRSRNLPTYHWLELVRWCITGGKNAGSRQWAAFATFARIYLRADITTVVSYSDPGEGHTGALYRACNWLWAPTWHRLRPPPTGNGEWTEGVPQSVKDRWIYPLRPDPEREQILAVRDESIIRRMPWAQYREPRWRGGSFRPETGGGDFRRFKETIRDDAED